MVTIGLVIILAWGAGMGQNGYKRFRVGAIADLQGHL